MTVEEALKKYGGSRRLAGVRFILLFFMRKGFFGSALVPFERGIFLPI